MRSGLFCKRPFGLNRRLDFPSQTPQQFANGILAHADPPGDLPLRVSLALELLHQTSPRAAQAWAPWRIAVRTSQSGQAALLESALIPPHRARRTSERAGDLRLSGPSLLDQMDSCVSLGHRIAQRILSQDNPGHQHHAMLILRADQTTRVDDLEAFGVAEIGKEVVGFGSAHNERRLSGGQKSGQVWVRTPRSLRVRKKLGNRGEG